MAVLREPAIQILLTNHVITRFSRRFRDHDLLESIGRAEVVTTREVCRMMRKSITFEFAMLDRQLSALFVGRKCQDAYLIFTVYTPRASR